METEADKVLKKETQIAALKILLQDVKKLLANETM